LLRKGKCRSAGRLAQTAVLPASLQTLSLIRPQPARPQLLTSSAGSRYPHARLAAAAGIA
jgi:hypothetical protein